MKILITGANGFIGNYIFNDFKKNKSFLIYGTDKENSRSDNIKKIDLLDEKSFRSYFKQIKPDIIIHTAARTDSEGKNLTDYEINFVFIPILKSIIDELDMNPYIIFFSSMLATSKIKNSIYFYSKSKSIMEEMIYSLNFKNYLIVRPTSIYGPGFGPPYKNYFSLLINKTFVAHPRNCATKSFGYVGNVSFQIGEFIKLKHKSKFPLYVGDYTPINIYDLSVLIKKYRKRKGIFLYFPLIFFYLFAVLGDLFKVIKIPFFMNTYRYKNFSVDRIINMDKTQEIIPKLPFEIEKSIFLTQKTIQ
ncbi:MAG: hypothetical protein CBB97_02660 [Candidatus Endolissoclinum sp. TMED37]|nr:MAG: hypothetical protein CBB97_02660 [Candidatus Endolissoclinum sp. TMED37]